MSVQTPTTSTKTNPYEVIAVHAITESRLDSNQQAIHRRALDEDEVRYLVEGGESISDLADARHRVVEASAIVEASSEGTTETTFGSEQTLLERAHAYVDLTGYYFQNTIREVERIIATTKGNPLTAVTVFTATTDRIASEHLAIGR